jgi:predicted DNA-binding antitoxin AbrB/MazE fold protein
MRLVARYSDGVLQPYETLELPEGTEVEILLRLRK